MKLPKDWKPTTIGSLADKVAMGPFGSSIKVDTFVLEGVPVISGQHLRGLRVDDSPGFNFVTTEHADRLANANVSRGDIVLTHRGNIGQVAYIPADSQYERYVVSQSQFLLRCDPSIAVPEFVTIYLKSHEGQYKLLANTAQVGVPSIARPVTYLRTVEIPLPPLAEQRAIAHVLGTLDDKIELNRRMNETLEAMARALFTSRFVDFEPVRAKMDGRWRRGESLPGLPADLWDLFPDRLVPSQLGNIPEGWEVKALGEVVDVLSGGTPRTSEPGYWNGSIPWYTPKDAPTLSDIYVLDTERTIAQEGIDHSAAQLLPTGTTVISARGTVGRLALLGVPMTINQTCYGLRGMPGYPDFFTYWTIRHATDELQLRTHGTIFDTITRDTFKVVDVVAPPTTLGQAFDSVVGSLMDKVLYNLRESLALAAQRDALLPRLVSGEVRV